MKQGSRKKKKGRKIFVSKFETGSSILWALREFAREQDPERFAVLDYHDAQDLVDLFDCKTAKNFHAFFKRGGLIDTIQLRALAKG